MEERIEEELKAEGWVNPDIDATETRKDELRDDLQEEVWERLELDGYTRVAEMDAQDLETMGEGGNPEPFRIMYDKQVPNVVNKYLKKYKLRANPHTVLEDGQSLWRIDISDKLRADIKEKGQPRF